MIGQVLATSVIQSLGKQQTLEGIKSDQHIDVFTSYTRGVVGLNISLARTHSSFLVSRSICFIKSTSLLLLLLLLLSAHICVTEYNTKYRYIFPLTYMKETAWSWKHYFLTLMPKIQASQYENARYKQHKASCLWTWQKKKASRYSLNWKKKKEKKNLYTH